ncbi:MAG: response regulator transcription factor [Candidatus Acidiferrum sp.]
MRILVADDHEVVREGICAIIGSRHDLEVCGEASDGEEAVQRCLELNPDLAILDVTMPVLDGFNAAKNIKEVLPQLPILILSMHAGSTMTKVSQSVGVQGFVSKSEVADVLLKAVDVLLAGGTFFPTSDSIASALKS